MPLKRKQSNGILSYFNEADDSTRLKRTLNVEYEFIPRFIQIGRPKKFALKSSRMSKKFKLSEHLFEYQLSEKLKAI